MSRRYRKYLVADCDLSKLRNLNEAHVAECLRAALREKGIADPDTETVQDIYAYALNQLPTLYPSQGASAPEDPVREWKIEDVVEKALLRVLTNPKN